MDQGNSQEIEDVEEESSADNRADNIAQFDDSDNNDVSQSNDQEIDDVKKDSSAENNAENSVSFTSIALTESGGDPGGGTDDGGGPGDGVGGGSDNNDVEQSNDQDIEDVDDGSEASNTGVNMQNLTTLINDVSQSNDQEIDDVDNGSHAENDAGNSVSFDGGNGGGAILVQPVIKILQ